jgi:predicted CoA-binding protein
MQRMADEIRDILTTTRRIAVVGASNKPERAGNYVLAFLAARGFDVTGVNPGLAGQTLHGRPVVGSLDDAAPLDMIDVFRRSEEVGPIVQDAIRLGARTVWMQLGVVNREAADAARAAGLRVVMDRCPLIEWRRLGLPT